MRSLALVAIFLASLQGTLAAPVTVWQTVTALTNADGTPYTWSDTAAAAAATTVAATTAAVATTVTTAVAVATPAATTSAATADTTSTSDSSSFIDTLKSLWDLFSSSSSSSSSTSSSSGTTWKSLLSDLLSGLAGDDSTTAAAASVTSLATSTSAAATATSSATFALALLAAATSATSTSTTSTQKASATSNASTSSSTAGIYDAIYNSSEDIDEDFAKNILDAHNKYRALHGVGDLSWAEGPYDYAKNNADSYDCSGVLTHTHGQYGENLAAGFSTGESAVTAWYDEIKDYDWSNPDTYDHFTQLIWKSSTQVGCAYKDCTAEGWKKYIVCEYNPVGNVIGQLEENVLPLVSS